MYWHTIEKHPERSAHVERDLHFVERDLYRWRETYICVKETYKRNLYKRNMELICLATQKGII